MSYLKDREIWLSNVPTNNPPAGYVWVFIQNGVFVVRDSNGLDKIMATTTGTVTNATSASYVEYSNVASKPALISGSSQVSYTGLSNIPVGIVSGSAQVTYSGLTGIPSGIVSGSAQIAAFGIFATTGSNGFNGSQSITGSLTVTGQVVAQTLNVQQVTSSVVYSSGSNIFGNTLANTQQFTGSVSVTGSLNTSGTGTFSGALSLNSSANRVNSGNELRFYRTDNGIYTQLYDGGAANGFVLDNRNGDGFSFQTAGTNQLRIASTGVATFSGSLRVGGAEGNFLIDSYTTTKIGVRSWTNIAGTTNNFFVQNSANFNYGIVGVVSATGTSTGDVYGLGYSPSAGTSMTPVLNWTSGGNVGISNTNPGDKLVVNGNIGATDGSFASGESYSVYLGDKNAFMNSTFGEKVNFGAYNGFTFGFSQNGNLTLSSTWMTISSTGKIGIGTAGPTSELEISKAQSTGAVLKLTNPNTENTSQDLGTLGFVSGDQSTGQADLIRASVKGIAGELAYGTGGQLVFSTMQTYAGSGTLTDLIERMRITSGGKIGIQNTDPQGKLEVGIVANNSTYGGHFFSTFQVPLNTWTTVFTAPNQNWAAITEFTWTSAGDYNRSGAAYMRWAYDAGSNNIGVVYTLFNNSQNSTATFRNSGGAIQINITGGAVDYYVQVRIQGSKAA